MNAFVFPTPFTTRAAEGLDRRGFTVAEVLRMVEVGVIDEDERFELIDGEIVPMAPEQSRHVLIKSRLARRLIQALGPRPDLLVVVDSTLHLSERAFVEPDLYVAPDRDDVARTPAADILLIIEVAASTTRHDLHLKAALYAKAGVTEYWVVDADTLVATVHRAPVDGTYGDVATHAPDRALYAERLGDLTLAMAEIAEPR
jgi:Uma2 family endonuclease